jgi:hypothetical protein
MLPDEDQPPTGERMTGRLYFERQPPEMREAIGLPMSGGDGEWPPEDDEAEAARLTAESAAWERFLERKRGRQNHHTYGAPETIAAAEAARSGKSTTKAHGTRRSGGITKATAVSYGVKPAERTRCHTKSPSNCFAEATSRCSIQSGGATANGSDLGRSTEFPSRKPSTSMRASFSTHSIPASAKRPRPA